MPSETRGAAARGSRPKFFQMRKLSAFLIFLIAAVTAVAQFPAMKQQPVKWTASIVMNSPTEGVVLLKAAIDNGWHLYSTELPADGPQPTTVEFTAADGIRFTGEMTATPAPDTFDDPDWGMQLAWWENSAELSRPFEVTGSDIRIDGTVTFMTCSGQQCLPPDTFSFSLTGADGE